MSEQDTGLASDEVPVSGLALRLAAAVASIKATLDAAAPGLVAEAERLGAGRTVDLAGLAEDQADASPEEIEARQIMAGVEERLAVLERSTDRLIRQYGL